MTTKPQTKVSLGEPATPNQMHLNDVLVALERHNGFSDTRLRDLRSSIKRVASLMGDDPARIALDLPAISAKLATISPAAAGLTGKSFSNIRSDFLAAVKASKLKSVQRCAKTPLSAEWNRLIADLSTRRAHIGLSRLAHYASAHGIAPVEINDATIEAFVSCGPRWDTPPQAERPAPKGRIDLERDDSRVRLKSATRDSPVLPPPPSTV